MIRLHSLLRATVAASALAVLAACAQTTPPPAPTTEAMRGAPLPAPDSTLVTRTPNVPEIGTEPMRGGPLDNTATDQGTTTRRGQSRTR